MKRAFPILGVLTAILLELYALSGADRRADRTDHGRRTADFLPPRSFGVDSVHPLHQSGGFGSLHYMAPACGRYRRAGQC